MLKGLALTPPVVGRISIGRVVERGGRRMPQKDDEFTITSQVQGRDGWIPHPIDQALRAEPTPLRLQLGQDALDAVRGHAEQLLRDLETWAPVGAATALAL